MDHNIPNVIRVIYLDSAFLARRLISRGITSARALYSTTIASAPATRVNSLKTLDNVIGSAAHTMVSKSSFA